MLRAACGMRCQRESKSRSSQLGANNGFLNDPKVTIPLPAALEKAQWGLAMFGMGAQGEQLKATMNDAAETAVAQAKPVFKRALRT
ncbi:MAG: DUF4197 family protein [Steroidobacteraceae bacterium]